MTSAVPIEAATIAVNANALRRIARAAATLTARGDLELAARFAQSGARLAYRNQVGGFALPEIDDVTRDIAAAALPAWTARPAGPGRARVLHVLSESYNHGGHTRVAERWISQDTSRRHAVALTRQPEGAPRMVEIVAPHDVPVVSVGTLDTPILQAAAALRELADHHDLVVLHIHPDDAVAAIALQPGPGRPPVVVMNHASCDAWIGADIGDAVACLRPIDARVAIERRGVPAEQTVILPLPLGTPTPTPSREEAREALNFEPGVEIVLTAGHARKYLPLTEHDLRAPLRALLQARPGAHVIAVGPPAVEYPWNQLQAEFPGRVHPAGPRSDLPSFYAAADVYVESFPIGGGTIIVEAALAGVPAVCYRPGQVGEGVLDYEPVGEDLRTLAEDDDAFVGGVIGLLEDRDAARAQAAALAAQLRDEHMGAGWLERVEAVYACAREHAGAPRPAAPPGPGRVDAITTLLCRHNLQGAAQPSPQVAAHAAALSLAVDSEAARSRLPDLLSLAACQLPVHAEGALAFPRADGSDAAALLAGLRELRLAAVVATCALAVPAERAEAALAVLGPILDAQDAEAGWELPVDVVPFTGDEPRLPPDWIPVVAAGDTPAWIGDRAPHRVAGPVAPAATA